MFVTITKKFYQCSFAAASTSGSIHYLADFHISIIVVIMVQNSLLAIGSFLLPLSPPSLFPPIEENCSQLVYKVYILSISMPPYFSRPSNTTALCNGQQRLRVQLISVVFEHSMLRVQEIYALKNVVYCIAVYGAYKP